MRINERSARRARPVITTLLNFPSGPLMLRLVNAASIGLLKYLAIENTARNAECCDPVRVGNMPVKASRIQLSIGAFFNLHRYQLQRHLF